MKVYTAFKYTKTDKSFAHGYDRYYEKLFENYTPNSVLEVGVKRGYSLLAWKTLFPSAIIHGVDISEKEQSSSIIKMADAKVFICDSTKKDIADIVNPSYDLIVDDGSHYYKDQLKTFKNLQNSFKKYYVIEDYYWNTDVAIKYLNRLGYKNVQCFPSYNQNITVYLHAVARLQKVMNKKIRINVSMIVITRD